MEVCCHLGAHCAEGARIRKTLFSNSATQLKRGVLIPDPLRYQKTLNDIARNRVVDTEATALHLDGQTELEIAEISPDRLVLTSERYFGMLGRILKGGVFYADAVDQLRNIDLLFPNSEITIFFVIGNPVTLLPSLLKRSKFEHMLDLTGGADPRDLRWSELFQRLAPAFPQINFTVCCYEDLPLLWGEFLREMMALPLHHKITGGFDLIADCMTKSGMKRFREYLKKNPDLNELQKRRVIAEFLDKFSREEKIYESIDLPGWDQDFIDTVSDVYETDVLTIARFPNVSLLSV